MSLAYSEHIDQLLASIKDYSHSIPLPDALHNISPGIAAAAVALGLPTLALTKWLIQYTYGYFFYLSEAKRTGLPYVSVPYRETNTFFANLVRTETYKKIVYGWLPSSWTRWARWVRPDWRWMYKYKIYEEMGDVFTVVTPEMNIVNIADADLTMDILNRRNEFIKFQPVLRPVSLFGENVLITEGIEWTKHRKVVTPPFSEGVNELVWNESIRQAGEMFKYWSSRPRDKQPDLLAHFKLLALNVLSYTEFGIPLPFDHDLDVTTAQAEVVKEKVEFGTANESMEKGHKMSFRKALNMVTGDFRKVMATMMVPKWTIGLLGKNFKQLDIAKKEIDLYVQEILYREQTSPSYNESGKQTLISALVQADKAERGANAAGGLSDREMVGNVYLFAIAGLDTTSSALTFIFINLAIHQDAQEWFLKQLDHDLKSAGMSKDPSTWDYKELFSKLTGAMSVVYEGLRTHPTTPTNIRWTGDKPQPITWNGKDYVIPKGTVMALNFMGVQYNPKYWGADAAVFRPSRWAMNSAENQNNPDIQPSGRFPGVRKPGRGTFLPWSEGFRACLGRRFAETEMAAVLATIFARHRCQLKRLPGENTIDANKRTQGVLDRATMQISLGVRERVELEWIPRK